MGLFGKKKTPEELLTEGRAQFESGDMRHMFMTLHGLANKGNPEACYYIGIYWLKEKSDKSMAKMYLTTAAKGGQADAAKLLAEQLGVRDFCPKRLNLRPHLYQSLHHSLSQSLYHSPYPSLRHPPPRCLLPSPAACLHRRNSTQRA